MKKKFSMLIVCFVAALQSFAQMPDFSWAVACGGSGKSVAADKSGNIYTTGIYNGTADFDPSSGWYLMFGNGLFDIYVAKYNSGGKLVWAKSLGGTDWDISYGITLDSAGNVYVTGGFVS